MTFRSEQLADGVTLILGDCLEVLPTLGPVDAVVSDVPYGIGWDRGDLANRLNHRVERMLDAGWAEEVQGLLNGGVPETCPAFEAVGYREVAAMIGGRMSRADAVWTIQRDTRQYAKRQITWFSRQRGFNWFTDKPDEQVEQLLISSLNS